MNGRKVMVTGLLSPVALSLRLSSGSFTTFITLLHPLSEATVGSGVREDGDGGDGFHPQR